MKDAVAGIISGVVKIVSTIAEIAGRRTRPKLDPAISQPLETEQLMRDMMARARADMERQKAAKKDGQP